VVKTAAELAPSIPKNPTRALTPVVMQRSVSIPKSEVPKSRQNVSLRRVPTADGTATKPSSFLRETVGVNALGPSDNRPVPELALGGIEIARENTGTRGSPRKGVKDGFEHVDFCPPIAAPWGDVDRVKFKGYSLY